jgi:hypothetical protein
MLIFSDVPGHWDVDLENRWRKQVIAVTIPKESLRNVSTKNNIS